jgi:hypothetical protein
LSSAFWVLARGAVVLEGAAAGAEVEAGTEAIKGAAVAAGATGATGVETSLAISEVTTRPPMSSALNFNFCVELVNVTRMRVADTLSAL